MIHLLAVPFEWPPDLHKHLFWALTQKKQNTGVPHRKLLIVSQVGFFFLSDKTVILIVYVTIAQTLLIRTHLYISVPV